MPVVSSQMDLLAKPLLYTKFGMVSNYAPRGNVCEWCGQPAVLQITIVSEVNGDEPEFFCRLCGEEFARAVADSFDRAITDDVDSYA